MKIFSWLVTFFFALMSMINIGAALPVAWGAPPGHGGPVREDLDFGERDGERGPGRGHMGEKLEHDFERKKPEKEPFVAIPKRTRKLSNFKL